MRWVFPPGSNIIQDPFGLVGSILDDQYRADAVVGEGGFGVVYRGRHLSLDQPIAIKALKGLDGGDPRINALVLEKFRAEARLLYTLSQSSLHIVRALDFGATTMPSGAWAPFMILEWLEGRSLADDLDERRKKGMRGRSLAEAFAILEPVVDGLSVAHRQQTAHRDVKPANIFLLADPPAEASPRYPRVKVLDFGIAKIMKDGESAGTKGTFASFTWGYATPEQLDPRVGTTGLPTDVYALALVLTELLTDRAPVDTRDVLGIMKVATDPRRRPTPRERGANIPDEIEGVCQRALAVDPRARYATVAEFWAALTSARDGARGSTTMQPSVGTGSAMPPIAPLPPPPSFVASDPRVGRGRPATAIPLSAPIGQGPAHPLTPPRGSGPPGTFAPSVGTGPPATLGPPFAPHGSSPSTPGAPPFVPRSSSPSTPGAPPFVPRSSSPSTPGAPPSAFAPYSPPTIGGPVPPMHGPMMPYAPSPPLGTPPPGGRLPPVASSSGTGAIVVIAIVAFVFAVLFAGSCALVHACT